MNDRRGVALAEAAGVFESEVEARLWIDRWNPVLGATPSSLLDSDEGLRVVMRELLAIEHGLPP